MNFLKQLGDISVLSPQLSMPKTPRQDEDVLQRGFNPGQFTTPPYGPAKFGILPIDNPTPPPDFSDFDVFPTNQTYQVQSQPTRRVTSAEEGSDDR